QYDVHPFIGNTFGPLIFMICVLGGLGNMIGGFIAAFIISQIVAIGGYYWSTEWAYVLAFALFISLMILRPRGILARGRSPPLSSALPCWQRCPSLPPAIFCISSFRRCSGDLFIRRGL